MNQTLNRIKYCFKFKASDSV